jgi:hypothetical protein
MSKRFDFDADTLESAHEYMNGRTLQVLRLGYEFVNREDYEWGTIYYLKKNGITYQSIYILNSFRNKGIYRKYNKFPIITAKECNIADYLTTHNIQFIEEETNPFIEYEIISNFYGNVPLINHIDEGLAILEWIGASETSKKAYCLHPILQSDDALYLNNNFDFSKVDPKVIIYTMEYRAVANKYLSTREINDISEIRLSPIKEIAEMLIADKIQNRKDFELYHLGTHPRSIELDEYFKNWLEKLKVSEDTYQAYKTKLYVPTT